MGRYGCHCRCGRRRFSRFRHWRRRSSVAVIVGGRSFRELSSTLYCCCYWCWVDVDSNSCVVGIVVVVAVVAFVPVAVVDAPPSRCCTSRDALHDGLSPIHRRGHNCFARNRRCATAARQHRYIGCRTRPASRRGSCARLDCDDPHGREHANIASPRARATTAEARCFSLLQSAPQPAAVTTHRARSAP
jgi:hypothetical protein